MLPRKEIASSYSQQQTDKLVCCSFLFLCCVCVCVLCSSFFFFLLTAINSQRHACSFVCQVLGVLSRLSFAREQVRLVFQQTHQLRQWVNQKVTFDRMGLLVCFLAVVKLSVVSVREGWLWFERFDEGSREPDSTKKSKSPHDQRCMSTVWGKQLTNQQTVFDHSFTSMDFDCSIQSTCVATRDLHLNTQNIKRMTNRSCTHSSNGRKCQSCLKSDLLFLRSGHVFCFVQTKRSIATKIWSFLF